MGPSHLVRSALTALALALAAESAVAEARPAIVVTPGSAQTYRAALQTFADESTAKDPSRVASFRREIADALVAPAAEEGGEGVAVERLAALVQGDQASALGDRRQQALAFARLERLGGEWFAFFDFMEA